MIPRIFLLSRLTPRHSYRLFSSGVPPFAPAAPTPPVFDADLLAHIGETQLVDLVNRDGTTDTTPIENKKIDAYLALRARDARQLTHLEPQAILHLLHSAADSALPQFVELIARDILSGPLSTLPGPKKRSLVRGLLTLPKASLPIISKETVLDLFREDGSNIDGYPAHALERIARALLSSPIEEASNKLDELSSISERLGHSHPSSVSATSENEGRAGIAAPRQRGSLPRPHIWTSFQILLSFLHNSQQAEALSLFQSLVSADIIPRDAIQLVDQESGDFNVIVAAALVRSCLIWGWHDRAVTVLNSHLLSDQFVNAQTQRCIRRVSVLVILAHVHASKVAELKTAADLLCRLTSNPNIATLYMPVIHAFYYACHKLRRPAIAARVYRHLRFYAAECQRSLLPPQGPALLTLMEYLVKDPKRKSLSVELAKQVLERKDDIDPASCARFIELLASAGFANAARQTYETMMKNPISAAFLVGNAATTSKLVSLFTTLAEKADSTPSSQLEGISTANLDQEQSPQSINAQDNFEFAKRVADAFTHAKRPFNEASHKSLTTIARIYFMLKDFSTGFRALMELLDRREVPDLHDVNVVLSAVAQYDPRRALLMIERMRQRGLEPDAVTYGTVIHEALQQRESKVVLQLVATANARGYGALTDQAIVSIIRSSLQDLPKDEPARHEPYLTLVYCTLEKITASGVVPHVSTGVLCVETAIECQCWLLAHQFWKLLLRDGLDWGYYKHVQIRKRIVEGLKGMSPRTRAIDVRVQDLFNQPSHAAKVKVM